MSGLLIRLLKISPLRRALRNSPPIRGRRWFLIPRFGLRRFVFCPEREMAAPQFALGDAIVGLGPVCAESPLPRSRIRCPIIPTYVRLQSSLPAVPHDPAPSAAATGVSFVSWTPARLVLPTSCGSGLALLAGIVTEQIFGAICDRFERATIVALDPIVLFPSANLKPFCSLSCSFEKRRARPSCSLSRSVETRFSRGSLSFQSWREPPVVRPSAFILGWPN